MLAKPPIDGHAWTPDACCDITVTRRHSHRDTTASPGAPTCPLTDPGRGGFFQRRVRVPERPLSVLPGLLCHLDDACVSNPCNEGAVCDTNPLNGRAICTCPAGFVGGACNQDMDECSIGKRGCLVHMSIGRSHVGGGGGQVWGPFYEWCWSQSSCGHLS